MPGKASRKGARPQDEGTKEEVPLYMKMAEDEDLEGENSQKDSDGPSDEGDDDDGDEADEGDQETEAADAAHQSRGPNSLYRLPTGDEMRQLKETEQLFKSNLFRLQVYISNYSEKHRINNSRAETWASASA